MLDRSAAASRVSSSRRVSFISPLLVGVFIPRIGTPLTPRELH
jgi:hypothetical protein